MQSQLITASNVAVLSDAEVIGMAKESIDQFIAMMQFELRRFGRSMQDPRVWIDETERNLVRQYLAVWEGIEEVKGYFALESNLDEILTLIDGQVRRSASARGCLEGDAIYSVWRSVQFSVIDCRAGLTRLFVVGLRVDC